MGEAIDVCISVGVAQPFLSLDGAEAEGTCAERSSSGDAELHPAPSTLRGGGRIITGQGTAPFVILRENS